MAQSKISSTGTNARSGEVFPLPEGVQSTLLKNLRANLGKLIFRRVSRVFSYRKDMTEVNYHTTEDGKTSVCKQLDIHEYRDKNYTKDEIERNIEYKHKMFYFFASEAPLRDNDNWGRQEIYCASNNYSQVDLTGECTLGFSIDRLMRVNYVAPRPGDLVCMEVQPPTKGRKNPEAKFWMTCSEQFMRMWTLVMYDNHASFEAGGVEPRMREKYMSGNRLATNGFLKWCLAHRQNNILPDVAEAKKRFWRLRTEYVSKKWVHLYAAIVLLARYGEFPTPKNVPMNLGEGPSMTEWDIPRGFLDGFLGKWAGLERTPEGLYGYGRMSWEDAIESMYPRPKRVQTQKPKTYRQDHRRVPKLTCTADFPSLSSKAKPMATQGVWSTPFVGERIPAKPLTGNGSLTRPLDDTRRVNLEVRVPPKTLGFTDLNPGATLLVENSPDVCDMSGATLLELLGELDREIEAVEAMTPGTPQDEPVCGLQSQSPVHAEKNEVPECESPARETKNETPEPYGEMFFEPVGEFVRDAFKPECVPFPEPVEEVKSGHAIASGAIDIVCPPPTPEMKPKASPEQVPPVSTEAMCPPPSVSVPALELPPVQTEVKPIVRPVMSWAKIAAKPVYVAPPPVEVKSEAQAPETAPEPQKQFVPEEVIPMPKLRRRQRNRKAEMAHPDDLPDVNTLESVIEDVKPDETIATPTPPSDLSWFSLNTDSGKSWGDMYAEGDM